jgi:maltose alpha-D-glucosyltransferase/alpha-amylase
MPTIGDAWYKHAIIYSVDVRRFLDSDGDGVGDFAGLASRLDYLQDLGVTCIWLLPCHPSPGRDNGYDVVDHHQADPQLGGSDGLVDLIQKAGELGIRVVLDLVVNHTSDQHPWFQTARRNASSRYHRYYLWADHPPPVSPDAGSMFPGEENKVWSFDAAAGAYYYHRFYAFQPELNFGEEAVRDEVERIIDRWMSLGAAGFRLDAASHLIENGGSGGPHPSDSQALLRRFYSAARSHDPHAALFAEVDEEVPELTRFFEGGDQVSLLFNFYLTNFLFLALAREEVEPILRAVNQLPPPPQTNGWANFLRNHDELNLQRLSDAERGEVQAAFAPKPDMWLYGRGLRRRLAPMFGGDTPRLRMAWSLIFSMPGAPVIFYGDEIGLGEDLDAEGRSSVRSPMQWSATRNAGFSSAPAKDLIQPLVTARGFEPKAVNVEDQMADAASLWSYIRRLAHSRRDLAEICESTPDWLDAGSPSVLAHRFRTGEQELLLLHNLSGAAVKARPARTPGVRDRFNDVLSDTPVDLSDGQRVELEPYGCRWLLSAEAG